MKLIFIRQITGLIRVQTGLHIGAGSESTQIGGVDTPIIRQPLKQLPYIPGSSLKGKLRALHELSAGNFAADGRPHKCQNPNCVTCRLFGVGAAEKMETGPCRLIVRDCLLLETDKQTMLVGEQTTGLPYTEDKAETAINRITGAAQNGSLRKTERVPAGVAFDLDMSLRVMDSDNEEELMIALKSAMCLLQQDALGGSGSRGYGKITFDDLHIDGQPQSLEG